MCGPLWHCLLALVTTPSIVFAVVMNPPEDIPGEGVGHCLKEGGPVLPCLSAGAVDFLEDANVRGGLEVVEGLDLVQDDGQAARTIIPVDHDPSDYRAVLDATAMFLERRSLRWDLGLVYPGLVFRVGPTLNGKGVVEFVMDPRKKIDDRSMSTSRLIMKRTLLPLLLGMKLNIITLVPIVFGVLIILIKKALIVSKLALLASTVLGYNQEQYGVGSLGSGYGQHQGGGHLGGGHLGGGHLGGGYLGGSHLGGGGFNHHIVDSLEDTLFKAHNKFRQDLPFVNSNYRDYSWTERDKKKSIR